MPVTGAEITSVNVGALSNLVPAGELIEPGDVVSIEDYTGANLGADSSGRLATTTGNALSFTIEPSGDGLAFKSSHGYLTVDPNGLLMVNGASPGTAFFIEITAAGGVLIADGTGAYWSWSNDGSVSMTQQTVIQLGTQFQMRVQPVTRRTAHTVGHSTPTPIPRGPSVIGRSQGSHTLQTRFERIPDGNTTHSV